MTEWGLLDLGRSLVDCRPEERVAMAIELARAAERIGMRRYWVAEHHNAEVALAAPEIAIAAIAAGTESIRVGSGGVLLQYYSALKVAEVYLTLAAAFPERVELGVCRGPGVADDAVRLELVSGHEAELAPDGYDSKVTRLAMLLDPEAECGALQPSPRGVAAPPVWLLGSGPSSVAQAIRHRSRYAYMCFFPGSEQVGPGLVADYLSAIGGAPADGPMITVSMIIGRTTEQAQEMHAALRKQGYMEINIVGDAVHCVDEVNRLRRLYRARSVLVSLVTPSGAEQLEQLDRLGAVLAP